MASNDMRSNMFLHPTPSNRNVRSSESPSERFPAHHLVKRRKHKDSKKPLRIMKFGGTSVGDASCIEQVITIIRKFSLENDLVVVVSAMSGVTNKLIEAATKAESGNLPVAHQMLESMRIQHYAAADCLIHSVSGRENIKSRFREILAEGQHLCQGAMLLRELNTRVRDAISGLGERLSAPLVAAALADSGVASASVEASKIIVTDSYHGSAEPRMELTRERSESLLRPLLKEGVIPIVTGFIGATEEGVLTTLGRGGSDYSATILGAVLEADEVIIWTDVNGVLTADPRQVPDATTIPEISYREASELAYFGAKVLHPKTLRPVIQSEIPVCIRNTFKPELTGTRITSSALPIERGVKALTAMVDVALITVGGPGIVGMRDVLGRTFTTTAAVRADVLLISQSSSQNDICFVVPAAIAKQTAEALRSEFAQDLLHQEVEHITLDENIAIIAVVGEKMRGIPGLAGRTFSALGRENVNIIAIAQGSSESNISFMVERKDTQKALSIAHREFELNVAGFSLTPAVTSL
ncbi:MAG TPA: aspartate kinase [Candidatus Acidoferrum sp.]